MKKEMLVCLVLVVVAVMGCGQKSPTIEEGTPSYTIEMFMKAVRTGDLDLYLKLMPAEAYAQASQSRRVMGANFDQMMQKQLSWNKSELKGAQITGETIDGNSATVSILGHDGDTVEMGLIQEPDGWKIDIGPMPR
jgi:hypothetical protein